MGELIMPAASRGQYQKQGLSSVRRDYNVLKAVRKYRGQSAPSWAEYLRGTGRGRRKYSPK